MCLKQFNRKLIMCLDLLDFSFLSLYRDDQTTIDSPYITKIYDSITEEYLFTISLHLINGKYVIKIVDIDFDCGYNIGIDIPDNFETINSCSFCQLTSRDDFRRFVCDPLNNNPSQL